MLIVNQNYIPKFIDIKSTVSDGQVLVATADDDKANVLGDFLQMCIHVNWWVSLMNFHTDIQQQHVMK